MSRLKKFNIILLIINAVLLSVFGIIYLRISSLSRDYSSANAINNVVTKGEFSNIKHNPILQSVYFTPVKARYVMLKAVKMVNEGETMGFAEIGIR